jgi:hypothetical protein
LEEVGEQAEVGLALFVAQYGGVGRDEGGEFGGVFAGFDAVAGGGGFAGFCYWSTGLGAIFAGDLGFLFLCHTFLLSKCEKPSDLAGGLLAGEVCLA